MGSLPLLQGIFPKQGLNPGLPHYRQILLPAEPQGKPKNTGVGSLSLFQQRFQTQGSNQGLLHCRQIVYQLSYEEAHSSEGSYEGFAGDSDGKVPVCNVGDLGSIPGSGRSPGK